MRGEDVAELIGGEGHAGSPPHARGRRESHLRRWEESGITPACAGKTVTSSQRPTCSKDHPRMRGEDRPDLRNFLMHFGSPPHARGRPILPPRRRRCARITPACAGKTSQQCRSKGTDSDHPRMRGEDYTIEPFDVVKTGITPACAGKTPSPCCTEEKPPDHPRMRGEDALMRTERFLSPGSPPHARGRRRRRSLHGDSNGITPACAGKTPSRPCRRRPRTDHPRMRGEDLASMFCIEAELGSPPHARGRLGSEALADFKDRITPACAGKTPTRREMDLTVTDHPRMRGEDAEKALADMRGEGSPPHARGRRAAPTASRDFARITPACAGKTQRACLPVREQPDHPRMRGEDYEFDATGICGKGSPPHARGRHRGDYRAYVSKGITPACAGKTQIATYPRPFARDHPRMRGEDCVVDKWLYRRFGSPPHARGRLAGKSGSAKSNRITPACAGKTAFSKWASTVFAGSPPHARGRLCRRPVSVSHSRITPACAGKTTLEIYVCHTSRDHPRMRGEDGAHFAFDGVNDGSPPHARGRPFQRAVDTENGRITPACAGKTWVLLPCGLYGGDHPRMRGEDEQ